MINNDGFVRSESNPGAILNVDNTALDAYKRQKKLMKNLTTHEDRLVKVEETMKDVKMLLEKLLEKAEK